MASSAGNAASHYQKMTATPVPKLVVFYNGRKDQPDEKMLYLSDSFPKGAESDIEVRVRMLNVNFGRNQELLNACKPLREYAWLVEEVRKNNTSHDETGMSSAVDKAINEMPNDFVIKPFLEAHRAEVKGMLLTEYNEAEQMELFKEDGRREGLAEGQEKTLVESIRSLMDTLELTVDQAMDALRIPIDQRKNLAAKL